MKCLTFLYTESALKRLWMVLVEYKIYMLSLSDTDKDNRNLRDADSNQKLKKEDLQELKKQGLTGTVIFFLHNLLPRFPWDFCHVVKWTIFIIYMLNIVFAVISSINNHLCMKLLMHRSVLNLRSILLYFYCLMRYYICLVFLIFYRI